MSEKVEGEESKVIADTDFKGGAGLSGEVAENVLGGEEQKSEESIKLRNDGSEVEDRRRGRSRRDSDSDRSRSRSRGRDRDRESDDPARYESSDRMNEDDRDERPRKKGDLNYVPREGDWSCPSCNANNFRSRVVCFKCSTKKPGLSSDVREGDWECPQCKIANFARRTVCFKCQAFRPGMARSMQPVSGNSDVRPGDWTCPTCHVNVFASKMNCFKCSTPRPPVPMGAPPGSAMPANFRPGDWLCPSCQHHNFASRDVCRQCNTPKQAANPMASQPPYLQHPYQQQMQQQPPGMYYHSQQQMMMQPQPQQQGTGLPPGAQIPPQNVRPGDWLCPCGAHVFASRDRCFRCQGPKPT